MLLLLKVVDVLVAGCVRVSIAAAIIIVVLETRTNGHSNMVSGSKEQQHNFSRAIPNVTVTI
jgi:hypothetical protein